MEIKVDISSVKEMYDKLNGMLDRNQVMQFVSHELMRVADDYVPFDNGTLKNTAYVTPLGDEIVYPVPYAQYQYNGWLMVDPVTKKGAFYNPITNRYWSRPNVQKELTSTPLHYAGEPKRGAHWGERAWEDYGEEICEATIKYIKALL